MIEKNISLLKRIRSLLNIAIGSSIGVYIGSTVYTYWEYQKYPELYAMYSAPWYTSVMVRGVAVAVIVFVAVVFKYMIKKKLQRYFDQ